MEKNRLKELRLKNKLTQKQLSEKLKIPIRTIQDWESGRRELKNYIYNLIEIALKAAEQAALILIFEQKKPNKKYLFCIINF